MGNATNCGQASADSMAVKNAGFAGNNRYYFVRIPLSSVPSGTLPATTKLRLYGSRTASAKVLNVQGKRPRLALSEEESVMVVPAARPSGGGEA